MIKKIPKTSIDIPKAHKDLRKKRKKGRAPKSHYIEVLPRPIKLKVSKNIWAKCLRQKLSYELIPAAYLEILHERDSSPIAYTDGIVVISAVKNTPAQTIEILDIHRQRLTQKEANRKNISWLGPTHSLYLDKRHHFLKRLLQRRFDITLMIDAYIELKKVMPGDSVSVSDSHTKILGKKLNGFSVQLSTGMILGEMDWDDFLDKKLP